MNATVVKRVALNLLLFKIAWTTTAMCAARGLPWIGVLTIAAVTAFHLVRAKDASKEVTLILIAAGIGLVWDSIPVAMGWISYPSGMVFSNVAPYWILALWILFATTLNVTFDFLKGRPWLAAVLGVIFGPVSYWTGVALGALEFVEPRAAVIALGVAWGILMPLLMLLAERFDGVELSAAETSVVAEGST